jgi:excisionase family DNA binding protein
LIKSVGLATLAGLTGVRVASSKDELTPAEVARELGVSPSTVRRYEERGIIGPSRRLPGSRHRRYARADVERAKERIAAGEFDQDVE